MERKTSVMASIEILKKTLKKDSSHIHFCSSEKNDEKTKNCVDQIYKNIKIKDKK